MCPSKSISSVSVDSMFEPRFVVDNSSGENTLLLLRVLKRVVAVCAAVSSVSMSANVLLTFYIFCVINVSMHLVWRPMSLRLS